MATKITDRRTDRQIRRLEAIPQENLEAIARANKLIVYHGKLVHPQDYPCKCLDLSPYECGAERFPHKPYAERVCKCRCHAYWGEDSGGSA